eukprot:6177525-Pleurochrysis_carterae.AAC.1
MRVDSAWPSPANTTSTPPISRACVGPAAAAPMPSASAAAGLPHPACRARASPGEPVAGAARGSHVAPAPRGAIMCEPASTGAASGCQPLSPDP